MLFFMPLHFMSFFGIWFILAFKWDSFSDTVTLSCFDCKTDAWVIVGCLLQFSCCLWCSCYLYLGLCVAVCSLVSFFVLICCKKFFCLFKFHCRISQVVFRILCWLHGQIFLTFGTLWCSVGVLIKSNLSVNCLNQSDWSGGEPGRMVVQPLGTGHGYKHAALHATQDGPRKCE